VVTRSFDQAAAAIRPLDQAAAETARELHDRLAKPRGALGRLETLGIQLAAMAGSCPPPPPVPASVAVFAADHGVHAEGVSPWPQTVTAQMISTFLAGGAAINVLARQMGASVTVIDVGVATPLAPHEELLSRKVREGTGNLAVEPAMSTEEARAALDIGAEVAGLLVERGARCLVTGEMGIANTTAAAALIAAFTGRPAREVTGRGTGVDDATFERKIGVVERALDRAHAAREREALDVLAELGGLEIAALAGFVCGGAAARVPIVIDGVIAVAATLCAAELAPGVVPYCVAGHRSPEPGAAAALAYLDLDPLLDLDLRLGEGTGACLALPLLDAAARVMAEMATLDAAGITGKRPDSTE